MEKTKPCGCETECPECAIGPFQRNYYFTGKLLVERDFRQEQEYYVGKLGHHHQRLHGEGTVCGLKVTQHTSSPCRDRFLCVDPGTAIDCCGREIVVRERECIDITKLPEYKALGTPAGQTMHDFQLCVRYKECPTEQIPVLYDDCGCTEEQCAPNRILESYEFGLIIDPPTAASSPNAPKIEWTNTLFNIADVMRVTVDAASRRLYVLTATNPNVVYQLNLDNNVVLAPLTLPGTGLDLAVSRDGARLYVALEASPLRQVLVVETAGFTAVRTVDIPGSGGSRVELAPGSDGHLYSLANGAGQLSRWDTDIDAGGGPMPLPMWSLVLAANARELVLSGDSARAYALDVPNRTILVADTSTGSLVAPIAVLPANAGPSALALVRNGSTEELAVADAGASPRIHLVGLAPAALRGSAAVSERPVDVVAAPDGKWAHVLVRNAAGKDFVQAVNLSAVRTGQPVAPGAPVPVGDNTQELVVTADGRTLFAPFLGSQPGSVEDGSLAILTITGQECCEKFWDALDGCPSCETGDCVVLATIRNYRPGFQMLDLPGAAGDVATGIARIDNRDGRTLLPSTQTMAEVIRCLCEAGTGSGKDGQPGADGQPGTNGQDGQDGVGLNPNLPRILDIGWTHNDASLSWTDLRNNLIYDSSPEEVIKRWPNTRPLLTFYFNKPMREINRQTFLVRFQYPHCWSVQSSPAGGTAFTFSGLYNVFNLDVYGYLFELPPAPGVKTPHTNENFASAWTFIPDHNIFLNPTTRVLIEELGWMANRTFDRDVLSLHVALKGDFIWAGGPNDSFGEDRLLDADNYGGRVGLNVTRGGIVTGGKNPSGDMVIGGDFESWFFLLPPVIVPGAAPGVTTGVLQSFTRGVPWDANNASAEELAAAPRISDSVARRIVAEREKGSFKSLADLKKRAKLSDDQTESIGPLLSFEK